ncbi:hypothetical protein [Glycomyces sp. NPDC047010]|uniref:hypothetical protein n=1 Tax=Glycomyces sp. NPDC047010 TaxID=3155023 RepID=UPI0033ECC680
MTEPSEPKESGDASNGAQGDDDRGIRVTLATQNLQGGGWGGSCLAYDFDRLPLFIERLKPVEADILVVNEVRDRRAWRPGELRLRTPVEHEIDDRERLAALGSALGLQFVGITPSKTGNPTAVLCRRERFADVSWDADYSEALFTNGCGVARFSFPDTKRRLAVAAIHASEWSELRTTEELQTAVSLVCQRSSWAVVAGSLNCPPVYGPSAIEPLMPAHHRMNHLTGAGGSGTIGSNLRPQQTLADAGFVDVAEVLGACEQAPGETFSKLVNRCLTSKAGRMDRVHVSDLLADAPVEYRLLNEPSGAAEHHGVAVTLDLSRARARSSWITEWPKRMMRDLANDMFPEGGFDQFRREVLAAVPAHQRAELDRKLSAISGLIYEERPADAL